MTALHSAITPTAITPQPGSINRAAIARRAGPAYYTWEDCQRAAAMPARPIVNGPLYSCTPEQAATALYGMFGPRRMLGEPLYRDADRERGL